MKTGTGAWRQIIPGLIVLFSTAGLPGTAFADFGAHPETASSGPVAKAAGEEADFKIEALVEAIILVESGGEAGRVGPGGERGLMQISHDTWMHVTDVMYGKPLPFKKAFDPEINRRVGRAYVVMLKDFLAEHRAEWRSDERSLLLACYNGGHSRVRARGFNADSMPMSSRDYILRVSAVHDHFLAKGRIASQMAMAK